MRETRLREEIADLGRMLHDLGLSHGSTGNISARTEGGWLLTPTNSRLGRLDPARIAKLDEAGNHIAGDPPSKEAFLHQGVYAVREGAGAIVHLHSTASVAVSCLDGLDSEDVLPPLTAYYVMRVGKLPLIPYFPTGGWRMRCARSQARMRRCCWPITGRWWRARASMPRPARSRSWRSPPGSTSPSTATRPARC